MELLQTLALLLVIFVAWLYLAKFISDNYQKSSGISSLFWVILLLFTASFLFGSGGGGRSMVK